MATGTNCKVMTNPDHAITSKLCTKADLGLQACAACSLQPGIWEVDAAFG